MKLVSILGLAGVASAAASSSTAAAGGANPIAPISKGEATTTADISHRILEGEEDEDEGEGDNENNDNNNNNAADLSGYSLQYSTCLRTKIASDDDAVEGNSYYVDGAYRAQYNLYATFRLCTDQGNGKCDCDDSVEYATEMENFLGSSLNYLGGAGGGDETDYLECTYGGAENGVDYYLGPQCSEERELVIGTYYDEDCTVKASYSTPSFSYDTFSSIESTCQDCSNGGCDEVYQDAHQCVNGRDATGNDDEGICSAAKRATTAVDYSRVKHRHAGAVLFVKVFVGMLVIGLIGGAMFLTYTYYLRHRGDRAEHLVEHVPTGAALT
eukprot:CAMPEP_0201722940 /NCGR_PEP_ID=MMETSP0593-20130828/7141_1 /ASSEMBLY_ACC=CAM_ASM_000672 /TAXON_ID=267983 /ORGANISM="Skeletonema japonicum, Strain CCMP2506" /LENGTH=326 /DNA_ID=CAMNT_0048213959 /DNA_START=88 /DNA_END=1068 /DNA_ORIENTATION=+